MRLLNCCLAAAFILSCALLSVPVQADTTIVIVRHAEKPPRGLGQLTCQGLNRSLALAPLLISRYGKPLAIFAPNPAEQKNDNGIPYPYIRPLATVEPLAIRVGLPVTISWGMTDVEPLAIFLDKAPAGTYVLGWEHHWGESLAKLLLARQGGNPDEVPKWADTDFDSIYVIRFNKDDKGLRQAHFSVEKEGLDGLPNQCSEGFPAPHSN